MGRQAGKDSQETRELILTKSIDIFGEFGYQKASMRMVQEETSLSKGTLYYHFKNKDELFVSCIKKIYQDAIASWETFSQSKESATDQLIYWNKLNMTEIKRPIISSLIDYVRMSKDHSDEIKDLLQTELNLVRSIIKTGVNRGEFRDDIDIEKTSMILLNFFTLAYDASIFGYESFEEQQALSITSIELVLNGIKK